MENGIQVFENSGLGSVRVVMHNGEPWFVAKDVCDCLELTNTAQTISYLDDDEKGVTTNYTPGGKQEMSMISEAGLYSLILRSRKPEAKAFKRWVTHDILPSIRKTGGYGQWNLPRIPKSFPDALRMIADIEEEKQLALEQRDYYKRTKAEIGSRREATSMATASAAIRQRDALADKLGEGKHYKQVKAIPWLLEVFHESAGMYSQVGRKLSQLGERMGLYPRIKEDSQYGTIKIHHVEVIEALRLALKQDHNLLGKYRKMN